jgi:uncharacterized cupin superfamily protein
MKIILDEEVKERAIRGKAAWEFFLESKISLEGGSGLLAFSNWLWDELGKQSGNLNLDSHREVTVSIPSLDPDALDLVVRLVSFWSDEVFVRRDGALSDNLWRKPIVNVFDDAARHGAERALTGSLHDAGSTEMNLMPLLGPGRSFFSVQVLEKGDRSARMHSHSALDEYYLILEGRGTLRYNGKEIEVKPGDLIGKPTGPDNATQLLANRGERLRILDMEVWRDRFSGTNSTTKDLMFWPDHEEIMVRGPGWAAVASKEALISTKDLEEHFRESYRRTPNGKRAPVGPGRRATGKKRGSVG